MIESDPTKTLHTGNVEALYKQVDSEMTGEKSEPEKNHSDMQHADDGERKGQEMVTYNHEQPKANGEGDAEPSTSQHEDTLAKDKIEEEWKEEEEQRRLRKKLPGSMRMRVRNTQFNTISKLPTRS